MKKDKKKVKVKKFVKKVRRKESSKKLSKKPNVGDGKKILNTKSTMEKQKQNELTHEYTPWEKYSGDEKDMWLFHCNRCPYKTIDEELLELHYKISSHLTGTSKKRKKMTKNSGNFFAHKNNSFRNLGLKSFFA